MTKEYEERLVCFIDLLGFKSAIDQSKTEVNVRDALYRMVYELKSHKLKYHVYGGIPFYALDEHNTVLPAVEVYGDDIVDKLSDTYPLTVTHFSDSFVLSCPADNSASCALLLESIYLINLMYFHNLGMLLRGGVTVGEVIHEEDGALLGPAMNDAYVLESKSAIYPRIIFSQACYERLSEKLVSHPVFKVLSKAFDGFWFVDLVSIFSWHRCAETDPKKLASRLNEIEGDVLKNSPQAHHKIAYLLDRFESFKVCEKEEGK